MKYITPNKIKHPTVIARKRTIAFDKHMNISDRSNLSVRDMREDIRDRIKVFSRPHADCRVRFQYPIIQLFLCCSLAMTRFFNYKVVVSSFTKNSPFKLKFSL